MLLIKTSPSASVRRSLIILVEPQPELSSRPHDEPPTVSPPLVMPACCTSLAPRQTPMQATAATSC
jgi:hypothetical protein